MEHHSISSKPQIIPLKIGLFGGQGSGKSTTAALIAAALSKEIHSGAPVWVTDTEPGWQFLRPRIFVPEKVELVQRTVPTFKAMMQDIHEAERAGACVWVADQLTIIWQELMNSFKAKNNGFIPINVWGDLRQLWNEYVFAFRNSKMHMIAAGRLGNVMEEVEGNKPGQVDLVKTGTAFKAGGSESFGYEPDFLLELSLERKPKKRRGKDEPEEGEGRMIHRADVLKDRTWALNGRVFRWGDKPRYVPGGYGTVWKDLKGFYEAVQLTGDHAQLVEATSETMIVDDGRGDFYHRQRMKQASLEEWDFGMDAMFPGSTAAMKQFRAVAGEAITGERSRTKIEQFDVRALDDCVKVLRALEERLKVEPPATKEDLLAQVEMAKEDVRQGSGAGKTLLEVRLQQSVKKGKPQPVVAVMDRPEEEVAGD